MTHVLFCISPLNKEALDANSIWLLAQKTASPYDTNSYATKQKKCCTACQRINHRAFHKDILYVCICISYMHQLYATKQLTLLTPIMLLFIYLFNSDIKNTHYKILARFSVFTVLEYRATAVQAVANFHIYSSRQSRRLYGKPPGNYCPGHSRKELHFLHI